MTAVKLAFRRNSGQFGDIFTDVTTWSNRTVADDVSQLKQRSQVHILLQKNMFNLLQMWSIVIMLEEKVALNPAIQNAQLRNIHWKGIFKFLEGKCRRIISRGAGPRERSVTICEDRPNKRSCMHSNSLLTSIASLFLRIILALAMQ